MLPPYISFAVYLRANWTTRIVMCQMSCWNVDNSGGADAFILGCGPITTHTHTHIRSGNVVAAHKNYFATVCDARYVSYRTLIGYVVVVTCGGLPMPKRECKKRNISLRNCGCVMEYKNGLMQADALQNSAGIIEVHGVTYCSFPVIPSSATMAYGVQARNHSTITFITTEISFCSIWLRIRFVHIGTSVLLTAFNIRA